MKFESVPNQLGVIQKARSVRSFAAQSNLTHNPDRSSLVRLYFRFVHVDGSTSTSTSPSVKNQGRTDLRQTQNKRFMKSTDTACYCKCCCNTIPAVSLRLGFSCFLRGIVFGTQTLWIHIFVQYVMPGSD